MTLVTITDATLAAEGKPRYCRKGIRLFCKKYNIDYNDFRINGIDSQVLLDINDSMGLKAVEVANGREQ